jgi:hypothetical protein
MNLPLFSIGDKVVCVDAADIPSKWIGLHTGTMYIIRAVDSIPTDNGNFNSNIHKKANYLVRLVGIQNAISFNHKQELGYAETRFEKWEEPMISYENMASDEDIIAYRKEIARVCEMVA